MGAIVGTDSCLGNVNVVKDPILFKAMSYPSVTENLQNCFDPQYQLPAGETARCSVDIIDSNCGLASTDERQAGAVRTPCAGVRVTSAENMPPESGRLRLDHAVTPMIDIPKADDSHIAFPNKCAVFPGAPIGLLDTSNETFMCDSKSSGVIASAIGVRLKQRIYREGHRNTFKTLFCLYRWS